MPERNALTELAKTLKFHIEPRRLNADKDEFAVAICKARRIIAELAKVDFVTMPDGEVVPYIDADAVDTLLVNCHDIAEEGAKMNERKYTAKEMREMADCISNIKQSEMPSWKEGEIITGGDLCRSAEMLRQAANVVEREEIAEERMKK